MTQEEWNKAHKIIMSDAEEYNIWRKRAKDNLLTNIGPRIAKLADSNPFHYGMETRFGSIIVSLAKPWEPTANHADKVVDKYASNTITKVIYETLLADVAEAELAICNINK